MLSKANRSGTVHSLESSSAEGWALERREYVEDDDNNSVSQSDESEENENGVPMIEEYDEQQIPGYRKDNSESSPLQMMDDGSEDNDADAEGDEEVMMERTIKQKTLLVTMTMISIWEGTVMTMMVEMEWQMQMWMKVVLHILQSIANDVSIAKIARGVNGVTYFRYHQRSC